MEYKVFNSVYTTINNIFCWMGLLVRVIKRN